MIFIEFFYELTPLMQTLIATMFTWFITALGSSIVFFFKKVNQTIMNIMMGFAAGIMIAATFWSLLSPSIEMADSLNLPFIIVLFGIISGSLLLFISDNLYDINIQDKSKKRSIMLVSSITLHNIPEGLVIGVAFGSLKYGLNATVASAIALAIGIGLQNFPEGAAVSLPLRREGNSLLKSFFYGQLSGLVEPISGILGCLLVLKVRYILPFALSFAAGAMIYVVIKELIPESQKDDKKDIISMATLLGFALMMTMDVIL